MPPAISVLMPCRNAGSTVDEALASILQQTWQDFELLAIDDGSSDATREHLEACSRLDPRVRVIEGPARGLIAALNLGLGEARAPLIARMDADDRSRPDRLERQKALLDSRPDLAAVGCLVEAFPAAQVGPGLHLYLEWSNSLVTAEQIERERFVESPLVHPSVMFQAAWADRVGGYQDHGWPEDYDLWLRMVQQGGKLAKVPEVLFEWREHGDRLTHLDDRYSIENFLRAKAHYLCRGPLLDRDAVFIWGAGIVGKRLAKHLLIEGAPLTAFVDVDPAKIGRSRRGLPILAPKKVRASWERCSRPALLAAVGSRGARPLVRAQVVSLGLVEGVDWWAAA